MSENQTHSQLRRRPAVHQLCVGSWIQAPFEMGDNVLAVPLHALGFTAEVNYLARYAHEVVGAAVDAPAVQGLLAEAVEHRPVVALCLPLSIDAPPDDLEVLANARLERARQLLAWTSAQDVTLIGVVTATAENTYFRTVPPPYRNRRFLFGLGGSHADFQRTLLRMLARAKEDERFAFALAQYHDAVKEANPQFRIARMFSVLEGLAYQVKSQGLESRKAVKELLGLSASGAMVEAAYGDTKYRFDCIEIAGRLRDKLFHGEPFTATDLNVESRPAFVLLSLYPDDVAHMVSGYCELELNRWANGTSRGQSQSVR